MVVSPYEHLTMSGILVSMISAEVVPLYHCFDVIPRIIVSLVNNKDHMQVWLPYRLWKLSVRSPHGPLLVVASSICLHEFPSIRHPISTYIHLPLPFYTHLLCHHDCLLCSFHDHTLCFVLQTEWTCKELETCQPVLALKCHLFTFHFQPKNMPFHRSHSTWFP